MNIYLIIYVATSYFISPFILYYLYKKELMSITPQGPSTPELYWVGWAFSPFLPLVWLSYFIDKIFNLDT